MTTIIKQAGYQDTTIEQTPRGTTARTPFAMVDVVDPVPSPTQTVIVTLQGPARGNSSQGLGYLYDSAAAPNKTTTQYDYNANTETFYDQAGGDPSALLHRLVYFAPDSSGTYDITATVSYSLDGIGKQTIATLPVPVVIHYQGLPSASQGSAPAPANPSPAATPASDPAPAPAEPAPEPQPAPSVTAPSHPVTISVTTPNPVYVTGSGGTGQPFSVYSISDPGFRTWDAMNYGGGTVTITLHAASGDLGTIQDTTTGPEGGYSAASSFDAASNTYTFTERAALGPTVPPIKPDDILDRVVYTAPNATTDTDVYATISYTTQVVTAGGTYPTPTTQEPFTVTSDTTLDLKVNAPGQPAPAPSPVPEPNPQPTPPVAAQPQPVPAPVIVNVTVNNFLFVNGTSGQSGAMPGTAYDGPVAGLVNQLIQLGADNLAISAAVPNSFIHTGSGDDAIDVSAVSGNNVLDGGTGSNFLVGGAGQDTFFLDARNASASTWSTVGNFHSGDAATLWGLTPQGFAMSWADGQGAAGHEGLTLHATGNAGQPEASLTLAGYSPADLSNGRLAMVFGSNAGGNYLYVHGN